MVIIVKLYIHLMCCVFEEDRISFWRYWWWWHGTHHRVLKDFSFLSISLSLSLFLSLPGHTELVLYVSFKLRFLASHNIGTHRRLASCATSELCLAYHLVRAVRHYVFDVSFTEHNLYSSIYPSTLYYLTTLPSCNLS